MPTKLRQAHEREAVISEMTELPIKKGQTKGRKKTPSGTYFDPQAPIIEQKFEYIHYPLRLLNPRTQVDRSYQRKFAEDRSRRIAHNWNPNLLDPISLSERENGSVWIIDGQHRVGGALMYIHSPDTMFARYFKGLSVSEEAHLYQLLDTQRVGLSSGATFKAMLVANDPIAKGVEAAAHAAGYVVEYDSGPLANNLRCYGTLLALYARLGATRFRSLLEVIHTAWPDEPARREILVGLEEFYQRYNKTVKPKYLVRALSKTTAENLIAKSRLIKGSVSNSLAVCVAVSVLTLYNKGLKESRLPEWGDFQTGGSGESLLSSER